MSLKEKLDARVRNFRSKNPISSIQEIDEEAKSCAKREWKKLKNRLLCIQKRNPSAIIFVGIYNNSIVWKEQDLLSIWHSSHFNKVQYKKQTLEWLCKLAKEDGFMVIERAPNRGLWNNVAEPVGLYWKYEIISYRQ